MYTASEGGWRVFGFGAFEAINPIIMGLMARPPQLPPIQCSMYTLGGLHYSTTVLSTLPHPT